MKKIICWSIGLILFTSIMMLIQKHEDKQAAVCESKNMVIVRPHQGKAYCTHGTRDGL